MRSLLIIFIILACFITACDVLDVKPQNSIPSDDVFKDKSGIEKGIAGSYLPFQYLSYYGRNYLIFSDLSADNLASTTDGTSVDYREIDANTILPENGGVSGIWSSAYEGINIANNVITKVPDMADMSDSEKEIALAELYFVRALNHFNLLVYFGPVPIKLNPTTNKEDLNVPRAPLNDVYGQIITDLQFAETKLPVSGVKVRASKYAAAALLARVYLFKGDYALAAQQATKVINSAEYELLDDYSSVFSDNSDESIFEIEFSTRNRNRISEYNFPKDSLAGRREVQPTPGIIGAYVNDSRQAATFRVHKGQYYAYKYNDIETGADNVIVLRLSEMYLIRAEAVARQNGNITAIRNDIDVVRDRAGLSGTSASTHAALLLAIEQERRLEFAFEGHRWFDLVRTGRATALVPSVTNINKTLYPIPSAELLANTNPDMEQNPGY